MAQNSIRTVISAEYKDILQSNTEINSTLMNLVEEFKRMNGTVRDHSCLIQDLNKWRAAHDAVQKALSQIKQNEERRSNNLRRNNIALAGLILVTLVNILSQYI